MYLINTLLNVCITDCNMNHFIDSTKEIRVEHPLGDSFHCKKGYELAHLVGLNLVKQLLNFYSEKRNITITQDELKEVIHDLNSKDNLVCEPKIQNRMYDTAIEKELLNMLFKGNVEYSNLSNDALIMFERLKALFNTISNHLRSLNKSSEHIDSILKDLNYDTGNNFPLTHYCFNCNQYTKENVGIIGLKTFCNYQCLSSFYNTINNNNNDTSFNHNNEDDNEDDTTTSSLTNNNNDTLKVYGIGRINYIPNKATVRLMMIRREKTVELLTEKLSTDSNKVLDLLKNKTQKKAEKMTTNSFHIKPVIKRPKDDQNSPRVSRSYNRDSDYEYEDDDKEDIEFEKNIIGYKGNVIIEFESDISFFGDIIDQVLKTNLITNVNNIRFFIGEKEENEMINKTLSLASLNAQEKAKIVLDTLQYRLKSIIKINIIDRGYSSSSNREEMSYTTYKFKKSTNKSLLSSSPSMNFIAPEQSIESTVSLLIKYEK